MDLLQAMEQRHAVRSYTDRAIEQPVREALQREIDACNKEGGLHIQLICDEPDAFGGLMARYGKFKGVRHYIALVGPKGGNLDEKIGYYGQRVVLKAAQLGLDSCWVALTFSKGKARCSVQGNEKRVCVIAFGYGATHGVAHKSKPMDKLCQADGPMPDWFIRGMQAAMLAPTAVNQQKFMISLSGNTVSAKATGGAYAKVDLGIVKYQFELGAGRENFVWG
nr:nitroreductase family protein [bacterium]